MSETDFLKKLGAQIAKLRKAAGFSQTEFALKCDMDRQNMNRLENGRTNPTIMTLAKVAEELGVTPKDLLDF